MHGEPAYERLYGLEKRKRDAKDKKEKDDEKEQKAIQGKKVNPKTIDRLYSLGKMKVAAKREGNLDYL